MIRVRSLRRAAGALSLLAAGAALAAAPAPTAFPASNPFAQPSKLPFMAPDFGRIQDSDYVPAFKEGMRQQLAEIARVTASRAAPSFDNTVLAMEKSGRMLERVNNTFFAVVQANTNDALDQAQAEVAPLLAAHHDAIYLDAKLFARVKAVFDQRERLKLDPESRRLLEVTYGDFVHAGANLSDTDKAALMQINKQLASLETTFEKKLLAAANAGAFITADKSALAGLSDTELAAAAKNAEDRKLTGQYVVPLQNTTQQPSLASLSDRATREKIFQASWTRSEKSDANDTRSIVAELAQLRARKAHLLGYPNYAAYVLYDQMARTPAAVEQFIGALVPATQAKIADESQQIQQMIDQSGPHFDLQPWDWDRYSDKVRKARYDLDQNELKPYFELDRVLRDGVFYAANRLYGLTFKERHDLPVYQADVRVFSVFEQDGSPLGLIYFDYFKRDNKAGGAWMSNFVNESKLFGTKPVVYNVGNFAKPAPGQPALLSLDDVTTMFHEFGHALHGLFANTRYASLSGANTARDWVEFPSQFNEHWAMDPEVLRHYAVNYKTGEAMPQALVDKIRASGTWGQGYALGELLAASDLDMQWHSLSADAPKQDVDAFEAQALAATHTDFAKVPTRYRSSYFLHTWANGYAAGYYAYQWTEMLDDDAYAWFMRNGGLTRANGQRFREMILSRGRTQDYGPMFRAFYGKDAEIGPMLQQRGLAASDALH